MKNVDSENVEPLTDLGLAPAYNNQCILTRSSDSGAGVNAASRVDTTFVASDPLSELVWSPHKGLSLKYTECSFSEKNPSVLQDVRPSNVVLSPPQSLTSRESTGDKQVNEENLITSQVGVHLERVLGEGTSMVRSSHECRVDGPESHNTADFLMLMTKKFEPDKRKMNSTSSEEQTGPMIQWKGIDSPEPNLSPSDRKNKKLSSVEEEHRSLTNMVGSTSFFPLEELECTAENDLQLVIGKDSRGLSEERIPSQDSAPSVSSPTNSRTSLYRRKGKEKALSGGDLNERRSKDEDESHGSVESCNSAGLLSRGKKRWNFREQLIVGSKRVKRQSQESPAPTSCVRQGSSFMNWISNMVNGLKKGSEDEPPSLALTLAPTPVPNLEPENRNRSRNTGFQNIFQSLYCPKPKEEETKLLNGNDLTEGSKELGLAHKISNSDVGPLACHMKSDKLDKQSSFSNKKPLSASIPEIYKTSSSSDQNNGACNLACLTAKDGRNSSSSSLGKHKIDSAENNDSYPPPEAKVISNMGYQSDPVGSLWITRLAPKNTGPVLNLDPSYQNTSGGRYQNTSGGLKFTTNNIDIPIEQKSSKDVVNFLGKEQKGFDLNSEASFGLKGIHGQNDMKSVYKLNPTLPYSKFKNTEAMASVFPILTSSKFNNTEAMASMFARRLDALKHIIPSSYVKDNGIHAMTDCFYCGASGHGLHDCSEVTETERENLIRNVSSYDGAEESTCLCIKCFRLDHWAISCPLASRTIQQLSKNDATFNNHFGASSVQFVIGKERCHRTEETKQLESEAAEPHANCDQKNPSADGDKHIAPSSSGYDVRKGKHITPLCSLVDKKFADLPRGVFDAVRKIRLSRMDVLRWMNSDNSLFHLHGFFLRLRLGKWEEGLGGTGYHVACITGEQREKIPEGSRKSLSVNIGGIICLVESQCISNQDFLEDELMAWWCATVRSGGEIPSEDQLKLKFEERKRLGI